MASYQCFPSSPFPHLHTGALLLNRYDHLQSWFISHQNVRECSESALQTPNKAAVTLSIMTSALGKQTDYKREERMGRTLVLCCIHKLHALNKLISYEQYVYFRERQVKHRTLLSTEEVKNIRHIQLFTLFMAKALQDES